MRVPASGIEFGGRAVDEVTQRAPLAGAALGGAPAAASTLLGSAVLARFGGKQAMQEAFERHLMPATVLPSLDKRIENVEQEARQLLRQRSTEPFMKPLLDDPAHPGHAMFQQVRGHVHRLDARLGRAPDQRSDNLAGALAIASLALGLDRVDSVTVSEDGRHAFAVEERQPRVLSLVARVDTLQAVQKPLAQSSTEWFAGTPTMLQESPALRASPVVPDRDIPPLPRH